MQNVTNIHTILWIDSECHFFSGTTGNGNTSCIFIFKVAEKVTRKLLFHPGLFSWIEPFQNQWIFDAIGKGDSNWRNTSWWSWMTNLNPRLSKMFGNRIICRIFKSRKSFKSQLFFQNWILIFLIRFHCNVDTASEKPPGTS